MADRGLRGQWVQSNRILANRDWRERYAMLQSNIKCMTPTPPRCGTCDSRGPETNRLRPMLGRNLKRMELDKVRQLETQREDLSLKLRMLQLRAGPAATIQATFWERFTYRSPLQLRPAIRVDAHQYPVLDCRLDYVHRSLNAAMTCAGQHQMSKENSRNFRRLRDTKPTYSSAQIRYDFSKHLEYSANCSRPEVRHLSASLLSAPPRRFQKLGPGTGRGPASPVPPSTSKPEQLLPGIDMACLPAFQPPAFEAAATSQPPD